MSAHQFPSKSYASTCKRCGVKRTSLRYTDSGASSNPPVDSWSYYFPNNLGSLGSLDARPPCNRASESRRTRKMGRRRKVLEQSRAGGKRLHSATIPTYKLKITTSAVHAGPIARLVGDTIQITSVVDSAATWSVGEVKP